MKYVEIEVKIALKRIQEQIDFFDNLNLENLIELLLEGDSEF